MTVESQAPESKFAFVVVAARRAQTVDVGSFAAGGKSALP